MPVRSLHALVQNSPKKLRTASALSNKSPKKHSASVCSRTRRQVLSRKKHKVAKKRPVSVRLGSSPVRSSAPTKAARRAPLPRRVAQDICAMTPKKRPAGSIGHSAAQPPVTPPLKKRPASAVALVKRPERQPPRSPAISRAACSTADAHSSQTRHAQPRSPPLSRVASSAADAQSPQTRQMQVPSQRKTETSPVATATPQKLDLAVRRTPPKSLRRAHHMASKVVAFEAEAAVRTFRCNIDPASAFEIVARRDAAVPKRLRIMKCIIANKGVPSITVTFRGESASQLLEERVSFWSLQQMRAFLRALSNQSTSSRRIKTTVSLESIAERCPALWWSLVAWTLGCHTVSHGEGTVANISTPSAVPVYMEDAVNALIAASEPEVGEEEAVRIMDDLLINQLFAD